MNKKTFFEIKKRAILIKLAQDNKDPYDYVVERWVANGDNTCPVCTFLDKLGWVRYNSLPDFKSAHSELGGPNWGSKDDACQCIIETRQYKTPIDQLKTKFTASSFDEVKNMWYITYQSLSSHKAFNCNCGKNH